MLSLLKCSSQKGKSHNSLTAQSNSSLSSSSLIVELTNAASLNFDGHILSVTHPELTIYQELKVYPPSFTWDIGLIQISPDVLVKSTF